MDLTTRLLGGTRKKKVIDVICDTQANKYTSGYDCEFRGWRSEVPFLRWWGTGGSLN